MCNEGGGVLAGPDGRAGSLVCLKVSLFVLISSGLPTAAAVCLPPDKEILVLFFFFFFFFLTFQHENSKANTSHVLKEI